MLHTKFQVSSSSGTYFSGTQIWPKSAVNWVLYVYSPSKRFCSLLGFDFWVMKGCFYDVFGLPYRLASLLILTFNKENVSKIYSMFSVFVYYLSFSLCVFLSIFLSCLSVCLHLSLCFSLYILHSRSFCTRSMIRRYM